MLEVRSIVDAKGRPRTWFGVTAGPAGLWLIIGWACRVVQCRNASSRAAPKRSHLLAQKRCGCGNIGSSQGVSLGATRAFIRGRTRELPDPATAVGRSWCQSLGSRHGYVNNLEPSIAPIGPIAPLAALTTPPAYSRVRARGSHSACNPRRAELAEGLRLSQCGGGCGRSLDSWDADGMHQRSRSPALLPASALRRVRLDQLTRLCDRTSQQSPTLPTFFSGTPKT